MCRPEHFDVTYAINPWMDTSDPVNRALALAQWDTLRAVYEAHGHRVEVIDPVAGLPDMVFAANGGLVLGDRALSARFANPERAQEGPAYHDWMAARGFAAVTAARETNEGEGDFAIAGDRILAGTGFRSARGAHEEVAEFFGLPVVSLDLVDPRFYHLDTALMVLGDTIAYYPAAFSGPSARLLANLYPDAVIATDEDANVLGLNGVCDGYHVFLTEKATALAGQLRERGYEPVGIDLSELLKAGGSVKCCTLELHRVRTAAGSAAD
ncbi:N-dimethylarginine dimethylaminohydrolase [Nocardia seriolae]|uniref:Ornithine aminotransferase n=2 Tax=Nocardia seriolae TaxID=37332 RepID=A0ABC8AYQ3_9NOCA|nr:dimethylargininase [Nocardia seriolae]APA99081.1 Ornithine aminotransferase [Nocardia seriolae]MTJ63966.1 N-dimethylarginine dimethylaminohydrolase [Nocardia seriolae]MTJ70988.1 N-dimethylarginine dimethylaminohydrolase [Nocardia seriolae]MTJ88690.1 N-dimethylarginine dimethylaminohydrolase [Nocardia seriolae]MTK32671.1 N-dimethylarginine dimethylaminohydrolase [Nocardia seriolae]